MVSDDAADNLLDESVHSINLLDIYSNSNFSKLCKMIFSEDVWDDCRNLKRIGRLGINAGRKKLLPT